VNHINKIASTELKVYPNPTNQFITIELPYAKDGNAESAFNQLVIMDNFGRILKQLNPALINQNVEVTDFTAGVYFVKAVAKNGTKEIVKFLKTSN